jgi:adenosylcobyric acid synthase
MVLGTGSSVGKSIITTGLCRVFKNDGYRVAPFKSQNMALNSFITKDGHEMGRAQVVQAEAAKIEPSVLMNPVLLKPTSEKKSQVIINGKVYKDMSAVEYHLFKPELKEKVRDAYRTLAEQNDIIILEGAGSPAEINLKDNDIVNMGMAKISDSPCLLVADIDKGGVFAAIYGTIMLLEKEERQRIKGIIINKFRGDVEILKPGLKQIEELTGVPVIGVLPYFNLKIEDEDSLTEKFGFNNLSENYDIDIVVIKLPFISNFTDFNALENIDGVRVRYCSSVIEFGEPDLIVIPGSKSTINDMLFLRNSKIEGAIHESNRKGIPIIGICAGMQILGKKISDPHGCESEIAEIGGIGLLDIETVFEKEKVTTQTSAYVKKDNKLILGDIQQLDVNGYEIHMGVTIYGDEAIPFVIGKDGETIGVRNNNGTVYATYLHGIFDNGNFCDSILDGLKTKKGTYSKNPKKNIDFKSFKETQYESLDHLMRSNIKIDEIYRIIGL